MIQVGNESKKLEGLKMNQVKPCDVFMGFIILVSLLCYVFENFHNEKVPPSPNS